MYIRRLNEASLIIFNWLCNINVFSPLVVLLVVHFLNYFPFVKAYEVFFISFVTSYWCTILFPPTGVDHPKRKRAWLCSVSPQRTVLIFHRTGKSTIFLFFAFFLFIQKLGPSSSEPSWPGWSCYQELASLLFSLLKFWESTMVRKSWKVVLFWFCFSWL